MQKAAMPTTGLVGREVDGRLGGGGRGGGRGKDSETGRFIANRRRESVNAMVLGENSRGRGGGGGGGDDDYGGGDGGGGDA